jgi:hypothetical protein
MFKQLRLKIKGYKHYLVRKSNKLKDSKEIKAVFELLLEISMLGALSLLAYLSFVSGNLLIKLFGFGSAIWLFREKILPQITQLLGSISLVRIYGR